MTRFPSIFYFMSHMAMNHFLDAQKYTAYVIRSKRKDVWCWGEGPVSRSDWSPRIKTCFWILSGHLKTWAWPYVPRTPALKVVEEHGAAYEGHKACWPASFCKGVLAPGSMKNFCQGPQNTGSLFSCPLLSQVSHSRVLGEFYSLWNKASISKLGVLFFFFKHTLTSL